MAAESIQAKGYIKDVTLVTHGTADRIPNLKKIAQRWDGPIAVAFYLRNPIKDHADIMRQLKEIGREIQYLDTQSNVDFSKRGANLDANEEEDEDEEEEEGDEARLGNNPKEKAFQDPPRPPREPGGKKEIRVCFYSTNQELYDGFYPVNTMRNSALRIVNTEYSFVIDIDLTMDDGLYR